MPANDEAALKRAVAAQPVSVAVCVNPALQFYSSGVFDSACCTGLNHGVLVTGYGAEEGTDGGGGQAYWRVKNSWGPGWGEKCVLRRVYLPRLCVNCISSTAPVAHCGCSGHAHSLHAVTCTSFWTPMHAYMCMHEQLHKRKHNAGDSHSPA